MKAFHETATSHYIRSSQMFHSTILRKPALFLLSKTDPVGTYAANSRVRVSKFYLCLFQYFQLE